MLSFKKKKKKQKQRISIFENDSTLFFVHFPCSATSTHVGAMILGRFIVGLGLGLSGPVTAMYVSEVIVVLCLFCNDS